MGKNVFANGKEISAKKDDNKSICAMPDVCLSPPSPPAGPIPIPYPNTAQGSDTSDGSKTVKIGGDEAGLKLASNYKKSSGDEAATRTLGMGVVTHTIQGKMKHAAWSMDVKFEGKNVIRHMDLTTHNHMNTNNSGSMTCDQASEKAARGEDLSCKELDEANADARNNQLRPPGMAEGGALTTAVQSSGGFKRFQKAISNGKLPCPEFQHGYQVPKGAKDRRFTPSPSASDQGSYPPCAGHGPDAPGPGQRIFDSEAKLLDPAMRSGMRGSFKMKIYHVAAAGGAPDALPCPSCKRYICGAEECGIKITLCTTDNREVEAANLCRDGEAEPVGGTEAEKDSFWAQEGLG